MSIPFGPQCLQCHLRRNLELAQSLGSQAQAMDFARALMQMYLAAPKDVASPWFNPQVSDLLQAHYGLPQDRFRAEKEASNRFVLERMETLSQRAAAAPDPVLAGLRLAILGNYLDFSALQGQVRFETLETMLDEAMDMPLDMQTYEQLRHWPFWEIIWTFPPCRARSALRRWKPCWTKPWTCPWICRPMNSCARIWHPGPGCCT